MIGGLGAVDLGMLAVLAASIIVGLLRGLVFEVLALLGWVAAYFVAQWYGPEIAPALPIGAPGSGLNWAAAFALVFVATVIVWSLAARLVKLLLHATPLSGIDRVGGAAFGLVRGAVLLLALATVVHVTPAAQSPLWQASVGAVWLDASIDVLRPLLPSDVGPWLPAGLRN